MRVNKHFFTVLSVSVMLLAVCGCLVPIEKPQVEYLGTKVMKGDGYYNFMVCVTPQAQEIRDRNDRIAAVSLDDYQYDVAHQSSPENILLPDTYTLTLEDFLKSGTTPKPGPHIVVQLQKREKKIIGKRYLIKTFMSNQKFNKKMECYPRYCDYIYNADNIHLNANVYFEIPQLKGVGGVISSGSGRSDKNGALYFPILAYIKEGSERKEGLGFHFKCPDLNIDIDVRVPREVFRAYR